MKHAVIAAGILALAATAARAQTQSTPPIMDYQGKLTDIDGNPLADGNYTLEFNIYGAKTGGAVVWGPQVFDGDVASTGHGLKPRLLDGHFTVFLSEDTDGDPISDAFQGPTRYLGIKIEGGPELQPRQQVLGSPYAMNAEHLDGTDVTDILTKATYDANDDGRVNAADHATNADQATTATYAANAANAANADYATEAARLGPSLVTYDVSDVHVNRDIIIRDTGAGTDVMILSPRSGRSLINLVAYSYGTPTIEGGDIWFENEDSVTGIWMTNDLDGSSEGWGHIGVSDRTDTERAGMEGKTGTVWGTVKAFDVAHPTRPGFRIVYASLEGPEAGMYHRGTVGLVNGQASIALPEHFAVLASTGTLTVQLTPCSAESKGLAVISKSNSRIEIRELMNGSGTYDVDFFVQAVRAGYEERMPVVPQAVSPVGKASASLKQKKALLKKRTQEAEDGSGL